MTNENKIHGPSVVTLVPTMDWHHEAMKSFSLNDNSFELVYVAEEHFSDGAISTNVCWRKTDASFVPKRGEKAESITTKTRIKWITVVK